MFFCDGFYHTIVINNILHFLLLLLYIYYLQMENIQLFTQDFLLRMLINLTAMIVLIRFIYYITYRKNDSFFTFFLLNFIVFLLSQLLQKTEGLSFAGSAFGLLAAFSLLRFRTESITLKDMTYIFIVMTIGLINSIIKGSYLEIVALNTIIIIAVFIVDGDKLMRNQKHQTIDYPSIENIKPEQREKLIAELKEYTGLDIQKITIEHLDITKKKVNIKIYYH
jgi:hypothetical protein